MRKIKLVIALLLLFSATIYAQRGLVTNNYLNPMSYNPAYAGESGPFSINGILGNQFNGGSYLPLQVEQTVVLDGQLYNKGGMSFQGYRTNYGGLVSTGFGLGYGKGVDLGEVHLKYGFDGGVIMANNTVTSVGINQKFTGYTGAGALASYKGIIVGLSNPMLIASKAIAEVKPTYFNIGYKFDNDGPFSFYIYSLFKKGINGSFSATDLSIKTIFEDRLTLGCFIRNIKSNSADYYKSVIPFIEYKVSSSTNLGLSYESQPPYANLSQINGVKAPGVFQVLIRYFNVEPDTKSHFYR